MRIRWTDPAVRDFTQICDYIAKHGSAATARRVALSIYERIGILTKFPECGRTGRQPETRELVFAGLPYLAVYRFAETVSRFFVSFTVHRTGRVTSDQF
jgi:toxin ParE1/3/4